MPQWWDQIERGLGQQYQPNYGTLSPLEQNMSNKSAMMNLGFGLLANADKRLPVAMGRAGQGLQQAGQNALTSQAAMLTMADQQKERKRRDEGRTRWQQYVDENAGGFGDLAPIFKDNPEVGMQYLMNRGRPFTPEERQMYAIPANQPGYMTQLGPKLLGGGRKAGSGVTWQDRMVPNGEGGFEQRKVAVDNETLKIVEDAGPTQKEVENRQERAAKKAQSVELANTALRQIENVRNVLNSGDTNAAGFVTPDILKNTPVIGTAVRAMSGDAPMTGPFSSYFENWGGTDANRLKVALEGLKDVTGLEALMKAKAGSSTGASGFGALSERELAVLQNSYGNLRQAQDEATLRRELQRVEELMLKAAGYDVKLSFDVDEAYKEGGGAGGFEDRVKELKAKHGIKP